MTRIRIIAAALAALLGAGSIAAQGLAFDWDASVATSAFLADKGNDAELYSRDGLCLRASLDRRFAAGELAFMAEGAFAYAPQDVVAGAPRSDAFLLFPSALSASWESAQPLASDPWYRIAAGRIEAAEPSGLLFLDPDSLVPAQAMDGLEAELRLGRFYAALGSGYLGLLDKRQNRVRLSAGDEADLSDDGLYWAPRRLLAIARLEAEGLLGQDLGLFGVFQKDFREAGQAFDSWYIGLAGRGRLVADLRHETAAIVSISLPSDAESGAGLLARALLAYDLPGAILGEARIAALWAGGFDGGAFPNLAGPAASLVYDVAPEDLFSIELGAEASLPAAPRGADLGAGLALRVLAAPGGTVAAGYAIDTLGPYLGIELEAALSYEPVAGFDIRARGGFLAADGDFLPKLGLEARVSL